MNIKIESSTLKDIQAFRIANIERKETIEVQARYRHLPGGKVEVVNEKNLGK